MGEKLRAFQMDKGDANTKNRFLAFMRKVAEEKIQMKEKSLKCKISHIELLIQKDFLKYLNSSDFNK